MEPADLDAILELQLSVAWAGEGKTDPARLGWWRTAFGDEFAGEDLLSRLAPKTWRWAVLDGARQAAQRVDARARQQAEDADHLLSLFRLGFEVDEQLDDRLRALKQGPAPAEMFPRLQALQEAYAPDDYSPQAFVEAFAKFLAECGAAGSEYTATPLGRRLKAELPEQPLERARALSGALCPLVEQYPLPHFRVGR